MDSNPFYVIKRNGQRQEVMFDKIKDRLQALMEVEPAIDPKHVSVIDVAQKVIKGLYPGVKTSELDVLAAETAAFKAGTHPDYSLFAGRIAVSNLHKQAPKSFSEAIRQMYNYIDPNTGERRELVTSRVYDVVMKNEETLNNAVKSMRDYTYDYFGFKTLERSYLISLDGQPVETPQYLLMRVSLGIHHEDIKAALETYDLKSRGVFTHATPTLFNSANPRAQMSSCFLVDMKEDSIVGIYETLGRCAKLSKYAGGIGLNITKIRAKKTYIKGTNGYSNGIVPMLRNFNETARYVDQGGGKRKGSIAIYLEPWHADIELFLPLKKNTGKEEERCRDLFYGLWTNDLFMKRVEENKQWSLFCPHQAKGLADCYGDEFDRLYERYEQTPGLARKTLPARDLWKQIIDSQIETGTPYMCYKDHANRKSNQQNIGIIRSSNLCTEIMEHTDSDTVAVCNLASIALPKFLRPDKTFDFEELVRVVGVIVRNLNKIIDLNYYPLQEAEKSNLYARPVGLGVQGLADVFMLMGIPFTSAEARALNKQIFETIYYGACMASMQLAQQDGPYPGYEGSPCSKGQLQFDLWGVKPSEAWDWKGLKEAIAKHGMRNSLLVAPMPTASTSQILGNNECFEPYTSNYYTRRVLAGEFPVINKHLVRDLEKIGLWTSDIKDQIVKHDGSVQQIPEIPEDLKKIYKTVWEISMKDMMDMSIDRAPFIDQSQSFNAFIAHPTATQLAAMHFHGWKNGLKTGMYYLRTKPAAEPIKFTLPTDKKRKESEACTKPEGDCCTA